MLDFPEHRPISAIKYALMGGQGLHVYTPTPDLRERAPEPFRSAPAPWAHLFDQDRARLEGTATALGVRRVFIHKAGTIGQHLDLFGRPLQKALDLCRRAAGK